MQAMMRDIGAAAALAISLVSIAGAQVSPASDGFLPSDAEIHQILCERLNALAGKDDGIGIVVGIVGSRGRTVVACGHSKRGDTESLTGDTVFEIGSVSKVFTALLLADMVRNKEVALSDPVAKYLPPSVNIPQRNNRSITLLDLATHTSGLPFMPDDVPVYNDSAAEKNSAGQLYQFLGRYKLTRDPGTKWDYSNLGYWLLSEALASRGGMSYEKLLQERIFAPLQLKSTAVNLSPGLKAGLAVGHNAILEPAAEFSDVSLYGAMPAAGGLVSTANDMLKFLSVAMGYVKSPLASSMDMMLETRRPIDDSEQALGWVVKGKGIDQLIMHEGFTWGYASDVAWDSGRRIGVVVLSNQLTSVSDIALHLLRPGIPLEQPTVTKHNQIDIGAGVLDRYVGRYEAQEDGVFIVRREGGYLTIQLPPDWGLPKFRLRPESQRDFFVAELPIRVMFQTNGAGAANGLLIYPPRGQHALAANRIKSDR
jgi:CubicO group peptidase (beta-lactamase class C family)